MTTRQPRASIVIPVYNQAFLTRVCLASLRLADLGDAEVIVVDNGSTDETPAMLIEWCAEDGYRHRVLRAEANLGFGKGSNMGASESSSEFILFLNNDTFVLRGWLTALLRPFCDPTVKVTGSRLLYPNGRIQHAGVAFNHLGPHHIFVGLPGDSPLVLEERDYQVVTGASQAIRREEFDRLGGFDASYENSFEDVDLCLKVRRDGGRVVYVPDSVAYHWESMTEGRVGPQDMRNYHLFMDRWRGRFEEDLPGLIAAAEAAGHDLSDRVPARREVINRQKETEEKAAVLDRLRSEHPHLEAELIELEGLRRMSRMRAVRAGLLTRRIFRAIFPRRD